MKVQLFINGGLAHSEMVTHDNMDAAIEHCRNIAKNTKHYWEIFVVKGIRGNHKMSAELTKRWNKWVNQHDRFKVNRQWDTYNTLA